MHLSELKTQHVSELIKMGEALEIENVSRMRKQELMFAIMKKRAKAGEQVFGDGVLEVLPDGFGFLRAAERAGLRMDENDLTFFLGRETIIVTDQAGMATWRERLFVLMARNAVRATAFFRLPTERVVELGVQVEM